MSTVKLLSPSCSTGMFRNVECRQSATSPSPAVENLGFSKLCGTNVGRSYRSPRSLVLCYDREKLNLRRPIKAKEYTGAFLIDGRKCSRKLWKPIKAKNDSEPSCTDNSAAISGTILFLSFFPDSYFFSLIIYKAIEIWNLESQCFFEKCFLWAIMCPLHCMFRVIS